MPDRRERGGLFTTRRMVAIVAFALPWTTGCVATRSSAESLPERAIEVPSIPPAPPREDVRSNQTDEPEGAFHVVQPGQTLWRIARAYGASVDALVRANGIEDPGTLEAGTFLFVPGADRSIEFRAFPAPPPEPPRPRPDSSPAGPGEFLWPVPGGEILGGFGDRRKTHVHSGIDIRGRRSDDILAAHAGRVVFAGASGSGYGTMVVLDHGGGLRTLYAHASSIVVAVGDEVEMGRPIAKVGRSGNATTEHCHFEVLLDQRRVDPMPYLQGPATVAR